MSTIEKDSFVFRWEDRHGDKKMADPKSEDHLPATALSRYKLYRALAVAGGVGGASMLPGAAVKYTELLSGPSVQRQIIELEDLKCLQTSNTLVATKKWASKSVRINICSSDRVLVTTSEGKLLSVKIK